MEIYVGLVLTNWIKSLENEFKLIDEGDLASFLGIQFNTIGKKKLELLQQYLIQRIIKALSLNEEYKMHDTPSNTILTKDADGKARNKLGIIGALLEWWTT